MVYMLLIINKCIVIVIYIIMFDYMLCFRNISIYKKGPSTSLQPPTPQGSAYTGGEQGGQCPPIPVQGA